MLFDIFMLFYVSSENIYQEKKSHSVKYAKYTFQTLHWNPLSCVLFFLRAFYYNESRNQMGKPPPLKFGICKYYLQDTGNSVEQEFYMTRLDLFEDSTQSV